MSTSSRGGRNALAAAEERLRAHALSFPETREDFPWGERVVKVRNKVFLFLGRPEEGGLSLSVKLPGSATLALDLPFASPTGYGLGKSGWVTARFGPREHPPVHVLERWIDESYRAVAPKRLSASLGSSAGAEHDPVRAVAGGRAARHGRARRQGGRASARKRRPGAARAGDRSGPQLLAQGRVLFAKPTRPRSRW